MLAPNDWIGIIFRLGLAMLFGAGIGWERQLKGKPAGLRTHTLVSLGAAIFVLVPLQLGSAEDVSDTISRVMQGVSTGIGFLGAGEIVSQSQQETGKFKIRGLTSAAAIWVSAALGVTAGCGLWQLGLIGFILCLLILRIFKLLEK